MFSWCVPLFVSIRRADRCLVEVYLYFRQWQWLAVSIRRADRCLVEGESALFQADRALAVSIRRADRCLVEDR